MNKDLNQAIVALKQALKCENKTVGLCTACRLTVFNALRKVDKKATKTVLRFAGEGIEFN